MQILRAFLGGVKFACLFVRLALKYKLNILRIKGSETMSMTVKRAMLALAAACLAAPATANEQASMGHLSYGDDPSTEAMQPRPHSLHIRTQI